MLTGQPALLLTGGTGLVGGGLLQQFLDTRPERQICTITRQRDRMLALHQPPQVVALFGDLSHPQLGLNAQMYATLQRCVTEIIHCAAETRFSLPMEQARMTNTVGTHNLLTFARSCRRLEKLAHISTVYVVGRSTGYFDEAPLRHDNGFCNTYQWSKYEAEELVVQAMRDLPAAIFRLSSIIGEAQTGRVQQFNYVHQLLRLFPRNALPVVPGEPNAPVDVIPSDWAIPVLAYLFESSFGAGRVYHICAGPEHSFTVREMLDLTASTFESHPIGRTWLPIRVPKLVSLATFEAFVESSRREGDRVLNELLRVLGYFLPHLGMFQAFQNSKTMAVLAPSGLTRPATRDCYGKVIRYCLETNWIGQRRTPSRGS
jgi:nucleoside-diphosphate-sugar epimerase